MAEIRKGLIVTNSTQQIKTFTDDISSNFNLNLGSGYNTAGSTSYPIQFSHLTSGDGEQKAVTINNGLVGIDISNNGPKAKLHIGKEYFGKNSILEVSKPASVINEHTSQTSNDDFNYYKIAQISDQETICYGGLNIKGTIIGKEDLNPTTSGFASNFMRFDITIMVNHANTGNGSSPNLYMIGTVNGSAMITDSNSTAETPSSTETDIIVSKLSDTSNYPMGVVLCVHKESVCNIEITSTAYNNSDINCFTIDYDGVRKPSNIRQAYSTWKSDCLLQLSDPTKNDIIYNTPHGVGINQNNPFSTFAVKGNMVIGSGGDYLVGGTQYTDDGTGNNSIQDSSAFDNGLLVEGNVGIGMNNPDRKLVLRSTTTADGTNDHEAIKIITGDKFATFFSSPVAGQTFKLISVYCSKAEHLTINAVNYNTLSSGQGNDDARTKTGMSFQVREGTVRNTPLTLRSNGNVGIGTNLPESKFSVHGNVAIGENYSDTASITAPSNGMIVEGAVGIGTDNPTATLDVSGNIDITGSGVLKMDGVELIRNNLNASTADFYYNCRVIRNASRGPGAGMYINYGSPSGPSGTTADCRFYAGGTATNPPQRMIIKANSGNVGIGTDNPTATLDVSGNVYCSGSGQFTGGSFNSVTSPPGVYLGTYTISPSKKYGSMQIISNDNAGGWIDFTDNISGSGMDFDGRIRYGSGGEDPDGGMTFYTNGDNEQMRINLNGNVGIGTNDPQSGLDISSNLTVGNSYAGSYAAPTNGMIVEGNVGIGTNVPQSGLDISSNLTVGNSYAGTNAAPTNGMIVEGAVGIGTNDPQSGLDISSNLTVGNSYAGTNAAPTNGMIVEGNVGIGTNNPTARLHVNLGSSTSNEKYIPAMDIFKDFNGVINGYYAARIYGNDSGVGETGIRICEKGGDSLTNNSTKALDVYSDGSSKMVVTGAGNVGIGTDAPGKKLEVSTDALISTLTVGRGNNEVENNTAIGYQALNSNTDGNNNTALGYQALNQVAAGSGNTGIGRNAGSSNGIGSRNTFLGYDSGTTVVCNDSTAIGYNAIITKSDQIVLGKSSSPPEVYIPGNVGIGTSSPMVKLDISGTDAIKIPVGNNDTERPTAATGYIRYNITDSQFEGCDGTNWGSLGGVKDVDGDTYISAETSANTNNNELKFFTANSERMIIDSNGKVGIGTTDPKETLHVNGAILVEAVTYGGNQNQPYLIAGTERHTEGNTDTTDWGRYGYQHRFKNTGTNAPNTRITVDTINGEVYSMNEAGDVTAKSYNATSDMRHKENITDLDNSLEKIKAIRGVNFNFKNDDKIHSGIIAQEVSEIIPEAICKNDDEKWTANYNTFIGYLIESVKTLSKENDELKEDIKRKGDVIVKLHNDVSSIKEMLKIRN